MAVSTHRRLAWLGLILLLIVGAVGWPPAPAQASRPNGAGLVVRHGDGRLIYVYVEFNEPTITGEELLLRSGLALETTPFAGQGQAICRLDGEGCPASDCFCESYSSPAYFWVYFKLTPEGTWASQPIGAGNRVIQDGDVDGWSWTSGPANLPATSIDEIARLNGVDRNPPEPEPTPTPAPAPPPPPTQTPEPTQAPEPTATEVPTPTPPAPTETTVSGTVTPPPAASAAPTATPAPSPTATPAATPNPTTTAAASPVARAVEIDSTGAARALEPVAQGDSGGLDAGDYAPFAAIFVAILGIGGWVLYQRRGRSAR